MQAQAGDDPSVEKLIDVCNGIERVASKYRKEYGTEVQTSSDIDSPSLLVRSAMLVLSLLFMGYAWQVPQVREFFGIPNRSYTTSIDLLNRCVAVILLLYTSMLMLTYKRQSIAL